MVFRIDPNTLYSKADIADALDGSADVDRFLARLHPKAVVMGMFLGSDLLDALRAAPDYREAASSAALEREARSKRNARKRRKEAERPDTADLISQDEVRA